MREPGVLAFIGKPCDVAALRALGRSRPEVAKENFLTFAVHVRRNAGFKRQ